MCSPDYPLMALRIARRHQLAALIRTKVRLCLEGFSSSLSSSLGPCDWCHDPKIFGLERDTGFGIEHQVEANVNQKSRLDFLLGDYWDVMPVAGGSGFRIMLTLMVRVDILQGDLILTGHSMLCDRQFLKKQYREILLEGLRASVLSQSGARESPLVVPRCATASPEWDSFENKHLLEVSSGYLGQRSISIDLMMNQSDAIEATEEEPIKTEPSEILESSSTFDWKKALTTIGEETPDDIVTSSPKRSEATPSTSKTCSVLTESGNRPKGVGRRNLKVEFKEAEVEVENNPVVDKDHQDDAMTKGSKSPIRL